LPGTHRDSKRKKVAVAVEAGLQAMHGFSLLERGRQRHPKLWPAPVLAHPQAASGGIYRHGRPARHKCRHLDHGAVTEFSETMNLEKRVRDSLCEAS
jgi:hypothetical protein